MAGMTKKDKSDRVSESFHKVRWWDMDLNQLHRDWTNAYAEATRALDEVGGTSTTQSAQKAAIAAVTVGMSWKKVQESHGLCMHRGEDRRTDFVLNEYESRWRRKHKRKLECWEDIVKRVEFEKLQDKHEFTSSTPDRTAPLTVMQDEGYDPHAESNVPTTERTDPQRDDDLPSADLPKISVQHMPVQRIRQGAGWLQMSDEVQYTLSYYDHDQRLSIQTHLTVLEKTKKRGGLTQFLWDLDLVWRVWTSTPRGTKDNNIVVHIVFAAPPLMRERLYTGKQMYATVRSVGAGIPTSPLTQTRSYVMLEVSMSARTCFCLFVGKLNCCCR